MKATKKIKKRLEFLRQELRLERISQGELLELQSLAKYIDSNDVELLEAAGVPEFTDSNDDDNLLQHAVINQLETDFNDRDFDAMSEMLELLIKNEESKKILIEYLSDTAKENWLEGKTIVRY